MIEFSLSRSREKLLPEKIILPGTDVEISVDADYRTILKCFRILQDCDIPEHEKQYMLNECFFRGFDGFVIPDEVRLELFMAFVREDGQEMDDSDPCPTDYEQDADAIYCSFLQQYGIDLIDIPFLHWRKFTALLGGLSDKTPFVSRIQLREADASKIKDPREKAKLLRAQRRVALREKTVPLSAEEEAARNDLDKALESEDFSNLPEILRRLRGDDDAGSS